MPDEMYPEAEPVESEEPGEDNGEETALLSKSLLGGECKVGDKYTVEVVGVLEDEVEVKAAKEMPSEADPKSRLQMAGEKLDADYS